VHQSSYSKMESFLRTYADKIPRHDGKSRILEIGSRSYEGQTTYKTLINPDKFEHVGLDLEPGLNVDIVAHGYALPEVGSETFDLCISGQTFEHNPFFWVTMSEITRALVPGGYACIIAPGAGMVHRYPVDCWRFYPDSWAALCALCGLEPLEIYFEPDSLAARVGGGEFRDSMVIARKPLQNDAAAEARRRMIVEPFGQGFGAFEPIELREGPCVIDYRRSVPRGRGWRSRLANLLALSRVVPIYEATN
jgi:SAM-dependent methyltransferase